MDREWLSVEEAGEWLGVPPAAVSAAIEAGELPHLMVGGYIRISRGALLAAAGPLSGGPEVVDGPVSEPGAGPDTQGLPAPAGLVWQQELSEGESFVHQWPLSKADKEAGQDGTEKYTSAWQGAIAVNGHAMPVLVGETERYGRGRLTVWLDRYPTAEFAEAADGASWASLIKPDSRKVLKPGELLPSLYRRARVEPYREVTGLSGSGVVNGQAVIVDRDDRRSAVHHAVARWLARQNLPVKAA